VSCGSHDTEKGLAGRIKKMKKKNRQIGLVFSLKSSFFPMLAGRMFETAGLGATLQN